MIDGHGHTPSGEEAVQAGSVTFGDEAVQAFERHIASGSPPMMAAATYQIHCEACDKTTYLSISGGALICKCRGGARQHAYHISAGQRTYIGTMADYGPGGKFG